MFAHVIYISWQECMYLGSTSVGIKKGMYIYSASASIAFFFPFHVLYVIQLAQASVRNKKRQYVGLKDFFPFHACIQLAQA